MVGAFFQRGLAAVLPCDRDWTRCGQVLRHLETGIIEISAGNAQALLPRRTPFQTTIETTYMRTIAFLSAWLFTQAVTSAAEPLSLFVTGIKEHPLLFSRAYRENSKTVSETI